MTRAVNGFWSANPLFNPFGISLAVNNRDHIDSVRKSREIHEIGKPFEPSFAGVLLEQSVTARVFLNGSQQFLKLMLEIMAQPRTLLFVPRKSFEILKSGTSNQSDFHSAAKRRASFRTSSQDETVSGFFFASSNRRRNSARNSGVSSNALSSISSQIASATAKRSLTGRDFTWLRMSAVLMMTIYRIGSTRQAAILHP